MDSVGPYLAGWVRNSSAKLLRFLFTSFGPIREFEAPGGAIPRLCLALLADPAHVGASDILLVALRAF